MKPRAHHWGRTSGHASLVLAGSGAVNGAALSAHQTWAFFRADLTPFSESPFRCPNGERATMAHLRTLPVRATGDARMALLAEHALREVNAQLARVGPEARVALLVGLDDRFTPGDDNVFDAQRARLEAYFNGWLARAGRTGEVRLYPHGHAALAHAILDGAELLANTAVELCIVGGVESYYDPAAMRMLIAQRRVFDLANLDTCVPGEGAAFVVLARDELARRAGLVRRAWVDSAACAREPSPMLGEDPCAGVGLTAALRAVTARMKSEKRALHWILADVTNEDYRAHEWGLALPRALAPGGLDTAGRDFFELAADGLKSQFLPEFFGDLGAATMPTAAVLALEAFARGDPSSPDCLLVGSAPRGDRGVVLLGSPLARATTRPPPPNAKVPSVIPPGGSIRPPSNRPPGDAQPRAITPDAPPLSGRPPSGSPPAR